MKKIQKTLLVAFTFLALGSLYSCGPEPCELVTCAHQGICDEGSCICPVGYEGIHCETEARNKFVRNGVYQVNEDGTLSPQAQYNTNIIAGNHANEILLKNVRNGLFDDYDVLATVKYDTMWITPQNTGNGYIIEGKGIITERNPVGSHYFDDAIIRLTYKVTNTSNNNVDQYGTNGSQPSDWNKN